MDVKMNRAMNTNKHEAFNYGCTAIANIYYLPMVSNYDSENNTKNNNTSLPSIFLKWSFYSLVTDFSQFHFLWKILFWPVEASLWFLADALANWKFPSRHVGWNFLGVNKPTSHLLCLYVQKNNVVILYCIPGANMHSVGVVTCHSKKRQHKVSFSCFRHFTL